MSVKKARDWYLRPGAGRLEHTSWLAWSYCVKHAYKQQPQAGSFASYYQQYCGTISLKSRTPTRAAVQLRFNSVFNTHYATPIQSWKDATPTPLKKVAFLISNRKLSSSNSRLKRYANLTQSHVMFFFWKSIILSKTCKKGCVHSHSELK